MCYIFNVMRLSKLLSSLWLFPVVGLLCLILIVHLLQPLRPLTSLNIPGTIANERLVAVLCHRTVCGCEVYAARWLDTLIRQ